MKHTLAWTIERFSERQEPNSQFLWSSKFTIRGPDEQVENRTLGCFRNELREGFIKKSKRVGVIPLSIKFFHIFRHVIFLPTSLFLKLPPF